MKTMNSILIAGVMGAVLLVGATWWSRKDTSEVVSPPAETGVISTSGLHWHPQLEIYIQGERQVIPSNIGVGIQYATAPTFDPSMRMTAIHTHQDVPMIHLEFSGKVTEQDLQLGNFFKIWGKAFNSSQLFDFRTGTEGKVKMLVNGEENTEFDNYVMRDGDRIEVRYE